MGLGGVTYLANQERMSGLLAASQANREKWTWRALGKTGIRLPVISFGVMNCDNPNLVKAALDRGLVHLDTAHGYMQGRNEEIIGQNLKGRPRDSFVIATKVNLKGRGSQLTGPYPPEIRAEDMLEKLEISLKRLGLEYVDIFYHHNVASRDQALHEPVLKVMEKAKKEGKVRFVGLSTHTSEPEVVRAAAESKFYEVVLTTYNFKQRHVAETKAAVAQAAQAGLGVVAMKAVGGHRLLADGQVKVNAKAAIKWVLQDANVHTVIAGCTTFDQLEEDVALLTDLALTDQEKQDLAMASSVAGLYCQGCNQCLGGCSRQLPLPDLMRAYMYLYGYRNLGLAHDTLTALGLPENPCGDCAACTASCAIGFDLRGKVRDVARLIRTPREFLA
jgi:predicted aldo/keto reductase-like oxidoreductase